MELTRRRKRLYVASWIPFLLLKFVMYLIGAFIMVPLSLKLAPKKMDSKLWPWGNAEEGCPDWWLDECANLKVNPEDKWFEQWADKLRIMFPRWWWYSWRNGANNMRYWFKDYPLEECGVQSNWSLDVPMEAGELQAAGQHFAERWVWRGWKASYRKVWLSSDPNRYSERWYGFKLGSDVPGCGFTWQRRNERRIGR